jgi:general secretion pathway protein A
MTCDNNNKKLLALFGIKFNPFSPDIPSEGLYRHSAIDSFGWRIENLIMDGGFALIVGDPGQGKSVTLRLLEERFREIKDVTVTCLDRPQSNLSDFYREICERFGIDSKASNRWGGYKSLREKWQRHIATTLFRPVLLIDEAQQMQPSVLSELRLLTSDRFDSRRILTIVLAADKRLLKSFETPELQPLESRIRARLKLDAYGRDDLMRILSHAIESAGNNNLMSLSLMQILVDHSLGNPRVMMNTADELLSHAIKKEINHLDEKLFFEVMSDKLVKKKPVKNYRDSSTNLPGK